MKKILDLLNKYKEDEYKMFSSSLIPNIDSSLVIGVRIPNIRKISKFLTVDEKYDFISFLPHKYLEENILHSIIINELNDFDLCINELDKFLPFVDNWSVCDTLKCKILLSDIDRFYKYLVSCINSKNIYQVRFAFVMMLTYFINEEYIDKCNSLAINYHTDEYYINMAIAWYFSYALIYQYDKTIYIFENKLLSKWIHNKSIQKALDSFRISNDNKNYLKKLRIK